jgi:hypothetical protein
LSVLSGGDRLSPTERLVPATPPVSHDADGIARLERSLQRLDDATREPQPAVDDDPVFVAGIGWRTGSTLAQRSLMTDPRILIWGEPLDRLLLIDRLTEPLLGITEEWPGPNHWISHRPETDLARDWVAMLAPDAGHLKAGYRALFDHWLAAPARERGFERWGVKEVRWSGLHAVTLRWLYPRSRFLVTVRHPVTAYRSMRNFGFEPPAWGHVVRWPNRWIVTLDDYARFWNELALSWGAVIDKFDARWIRYEDVVDRRVDLDKIGREIGLTMNSEVALSVRAGAQPQRIELSDAERRRINELTVAGRQLFSYGE